MTSVRHELRRARQVITSPRHVMTSVRHPMTAGAYAMTTGPQVMTAACHERMGGRHWLISDAYRQQLLGYQDLATLDRWLILAASATSAADVLTTP